MDAFVRINVTCPYCGNKQPVNFPLLQLANGALFAPIKPTIILCDIDDIPGCDQYFAASISMTVEATTYKLEEK